MHGGPIRILEIYGEPTDIGGAHGTECAGMIRSYLADRLALAGDATWSGKAVGSDTILGLAESTLPFHESYSGPLFDEMTSLADAAGITAAEAVVVGGFTDLIDVVRASQPAPDMDECTAILDPGSSTLAQTWDMHASAGEYVVLLKIDPVSGPSALVQTTAGCLGQIGMNEAGIAVGINNLTAFGRPGVTWPFVVRKALQQSNLDDAVKCVLDADLAGGHNFLVMGPEGVGVNIEAMPGAKEVTRVDTKPLVHSNHCLSSVTREEEGPRAPEHVLSSDIRLARGAELAEDLGSFFTDRAISKPPTDPHLSATCGALIMRTAERRLDTVWGVPGDHPWETFRL